MSWLFMWTKNVLGYDRTEEQMSYIPRPHLELALHNTVRSEAYLGTLGTLVVGPALAMQKGELGNRPALIRKVGRAGLAGMLLGGVIGPAITYASIRNQPVPVRFEKCYRLRYDKNQTRLHLYPIALANAGLAVGSFIGTPGLMAFGLSAGLAGGVILAVGSNMVMNEKYDVPRDAQWIKEKSRICDGTGFTYKAFW